MQRSLAIVILSAFARRVGVRKILGGTRSNAGTKTRLTLACLRGTWQQCCLNPFTECLAALQHPAQAAPKLHRRRFPYPNSER